MKEMLIGLAVGIVAVIAAQLFIQRPAPPPPEVRELSTVWGTSSLAELGKPLIPSTQPDPFALKLTVVLDRIEYKEKTLDEVTALLTQRTGCNFYIDWPAIQAAHIKRDIRASLALQNVTAAGALKRILANFTEANDELGYRMEDGIVRITTTDQLIRSTVIRVYDVRDLVQTQLDLKSKSPTGSPSLLSDAESTGDALGKLIEETIDPVNWRNAGGVSGGVRYFVGRLIITQTPENHEAINQLLAAMRRKQQ